MKAVKNTLASAVAALCIPMGMALTSTAVQAEVTGNAGITSDYLWRGVTQTDHASAVSGGIDYGHSSGVYAGTWVSNVATDTEIDVYGGFGGKIAGISYDLGYIYYHYPNVLADFAEVYGSVGYSIASVSYSVDSENKTNYLAVDLETEVMGLGVGVIVGMYMNDDSTSDYMHYDATISKEMGDHWEATFAVSATDDEHDNPVATFSMSKSFDLIK